MKNSKLKTTLLSTVAVLAVAATVASTRPVVADNDRDHDRDDHVVNADQLKTATPIKHLVVIFDENRSFDHYFGTYPNALNPEGEPVFEPARHTPRDINNLLSNPALLENNPNLNPANGTGASNPFRLDRTQANTADQSHNYTKEQQAYDGGLNDLFPLDVGRGNAGGAGAFGTTAQVMRAGCPMLVMPYGFDQPDNADRIQRLGLGLTISRKAYSGAAAAGHLRELLERPFYKENAVRVRHAIQRETGAMTAALALENLLEK